MVGYSQVQQTEDFRFKIILWENCVGKREFCLDKSLALLPTGQELACRGLGNVPVVLIISGFLFHRVVLSTNFDYKGG